MAKKKLDPRVQQMVASFNRKPTDAEQADFYRRNAGGPIACYPSLTRGRGIVSGIVGDYDAHVGTRRSYETAQYLDRDQEKRRQTYHHAHIDAFEALHADEWVRDFLAKMKHPHTEHIRAYFYHLHPQYKTADMLNPFLLDP